MPSNSVATNHGDPDLSLTLCNLKSWTQDDFNYILLGKPSFKLNILGWYSLGGCTGNSSQIASTWLPTYSVNHMILFPRLDRTRTPLPTTPAQNATLSLPCTIIVLVGNTIMVWSSCESVTHPAQESCDLWLLCLTEYTYIHTLGFPWMQWSNSKSQALNNRHIESCDLKLSSLSLPQNSYLIH